MKVFFCIIAAIMAIGTIAEKDKENAGRFALCFIVSVFALMILN